MKANHDHIVADGSSKQDSTFLWHYFDVIRLKTVVSCIINVCVFVDGGDAVVSSNKHANNLVVSFQTNFGVLKSAMSSGNFKIDQDYMPFGRLSRETIEQAGDVLREIK